MATTTTAETTGRGTLSRPRLTLRMISVVLALAGIGVTSYLTYTKLANVPMVCIESGPFNCSVVESSVWSEFQGIPIAFFGLLAHLAILGLVLLERRVALLADYGLMMVFGIALFGVLYHGYLIYVSAAILRALCPWCLTAATIMLVQLIVTGLRLRGALAAQA